MKIYRVMHETGWTKEVWSSCKLAKRVHNGGHTDPAEEGNGSSS